MISCDDAGPVQGLSTDEALRGGHREDQDDTVAFGRALSTLRSGLQTDDPWCRSMKSYTLAV